ncbi:MAG: hypothetical protein ACREDF_01385, partial [Thermoplasmata archaeon]
PEDAIPCAESRSLGAPQDSELMPEDQVLGGQGSSVGEEQPEKAPKVRAHFQFQVSRKGRILAGGT